MNKQVKESHPTEVSHNFNIYYSKSDTNGVRKALVWRMREHTWSEAINATNTLLKTGYNVERIECYPISCLTRVCRLPLRPIIAGGEAAGVGPASVVFSHSSF